MTPPIVLLSLLFGSYLLGSVPFGYIAGRWKGIDISKAGSGNIGATNVGRVLGRRWGAAVFVLDFLKGCLPVLLAKWVVAGNREFADWQSLPDTAAVGSAACTFLGHLFPIYLGFRGGKGIAVGAGTILVLVPGPAGLAFLTWIVCLCATSLVSLASLAAIVGLCIGHAVRVGEPFAPAHLVTSLYLFIGSAFVSVKHRGNISRLSAGTESRLGPSVSRDHIGGGLHRLALGWLFGASVFLQFVAGPTVFETFPQVVGDAPSDRTARVPIAAGLDEPQKKQLGNALAGAAIGPMFPKYFVWSAIAANMAVIGSFGDRRGHRGLLVSLLVITTANWLIAGEVSRLRLERFSADAAVAEAAKAAFVGWHLASLLMEMLTCLLAGIALFWDRGNTFVRPASKAQAEARTPAPLVSGL